VGGFLQTLMIIAISTSALACGLAFHNGMVRYLYAMGREGILPHVFGRTHPRHRSPHIAIITQSLFTVLLMIAFAFIIQKTNADGTIGYAFGIADGKVYTQVDGIYPYAWLAIIGTIAFVVVYIMVNISSPVFASRFDKKSFNVLAHIVAPVLSTLILLVPLISFIGPALPGVGSYFTGLGFAATPFPLNILYLFVIAWVILGLAYSYYLSSSSPERYEGMGRIIRGDVYAA
jgi:amino acid transporter